MTPDPTPVNETPREQPDGAEPAMAKFKSTGGVALLAAIKFEEDILKELPRATPELLTSREVELLEEARTLYIRQAVELSGVQVENERLRDAVAEYDRHAPACLKERQSLRSDLAQARRDLEEATARAAELRKYWLDWPQARRDAVKDLSEFVFNAIEAIAHPATSERTGEAE